MKRCEWCLSSDLYIDYHDTEWGVPSFDDRHLFEKLNLEGAQAGLSWITILKKRENYRNLFDNFDAEKIARYSDKKITRILENPGIVRNKLKVNAVVTNSKLFLDVQNEYGSFANYLWKFVDGKPIVNTWKAMNEIPANTPLSDKISKEMKKKGFKFIGSTIIYAFMQGVGMVNDHTTDCFRYKLVANS